MENKNVNETLDICYVRPRQKDDYYFDALKNMGFDIKVPYIDNNILPLRILRELHFRLPIGGKQLWFNKNILKTQCYHIIVEDSLITTQFMDWLVKNKPEAHIIFNFQNVVNKYTLNPNDLDKSVEKWTFDPSDKEKYNMNWTRIGYLDYYQITERKEPEYDVVFLGSDKGRAEKLLDLEKQLQAMGLKTFFRICADRSFMRYKKSYYGSRMKYLDYIELCSRSKAVLNFFNNDRCGITLRDMEVAFNGVKGITTNKNIVNFEFYDPSRFFILNQDDINDLPAFLNSPFKPIDPQALDKYRFKETLKGYLNEKNNLG